jgi:hypothetical protein
LASKLLGRVSWFDLKTKADGLSLFGLKTGDFGFLGLGLKTGSNGLMIWPQNHRDTILVWTSKPSGYGLSVAPQKRREDEDGIGHASRSSGLLRLEASCARISQSGLTTSRGMTRMVHATSSRMLHRTLIPQLYNFHCIRPYEHFSLLHVSINRTLEGWSSLPPLYFHFAFLD